MAVSIPGKNPQAGKAAGQSAGSSSGKAGVPSWMKTGAKAQAMLEEDEKKAEERAAANNKMRRFYLPAGKECKITFLDGKLDADGVLDAPMFLEHQVYKDGSWKNWFTCVKEEEPCPICEGGNDSQLVAIFTVIDHSEYKSPTTGKVYKDTRKLFVCKRNTFKMLQKKAAKQGGLAGCTFDVSRTGDKDPSVGNDFDFCEKRGKSALLEAYPHLKDELGPANYEEEIIRLTADELREMGFGGKVIGNEKPHSGSGPEGKSIGNEPNYDDEL